MIAVRGLCLQPFLTAFSDVESADPQCFLLQRNIPSIRNELSPKLKMYMFFSDNSSFRSLCFCHSFGG
jgi:hypothetical protein